LRERRARYPVGTPKSRLRHHAATLLEQSGWQEVQAGLEVRLVAHPDGEPGQSYVLCRSAARAEKKRAMLRRQSGRPAEALGRIAVASAKHRQADLEAVGRPLAARRASIPPPPRSCTRRCATTPPVGSCGPEIASDVPAGQKAHRQKAAYLLRTHCEETDPALLWRW